MSSSNRTTSKGGKGAKSDKSHKIDKSDPGKGSGDKQQSGGGEIVRSKSDDPYIKEKVKQVIEMTQRDENEVCLVLHECEYDVEMAVNMLFESKEQGTWETTVKKKKNRQTSTSKTESTEAAQGDDWNDMQHTEEKPKSRNKNNGGPPRLHGRHNDSRGWRGRERQENERNLEDGGRQDHRERRGRSGGPPRGGGRGGRGGGRGGRYPPRGGNRNSFNNRPIETWDNSNTWDNSTVAVTNHTEENWDEFPGTDEWSTEEYTGSLADTKVFTPSIQMDPIPLDATTDPSIASTGPVDSSGLSATQQLTQALEMRSQMQQQSQMPSQSPITLNAAQTQYLNQLTQQTSENMKAAHQQYGNSAPQSYGSTGVQGYGGAQAQSYEKSTPQVYNSTAVSGSQYSTSGQQYGNPQTGTYGNNSYGVNNTYGNISEQPPTHQPVRTKTQRARVPPPSKIPSSAVEMPGDVNSTISYLDVQFGAMDFMSDGSSIEGVLDSKYGPTSGNTLDSSNVPPSSNLDLSSSTQNTSLDAYASSKPNTQSSISSAMSQGLTNTDSIPQTSEHLPSAYNTAASRSSTTSNSVPQSVAPSTLDMNKQAETHSYSNQSSYNSYQPKSSSFQSQTYNSSSYSSTQVTSSSYVSNPSSNSYTNSNTGSYNAPSATNAYPNSYSSASSYQTNATAAGFPSISQANSYPTNNQSYQQTSQSVYGANTGLNSSNYSNSATGTSQYNSYNSASNHKLVKDGSAYDSTAAVSSTPTGTISVSSSSTTLSMTQSAGTGSKATTTLAKNSSSVVSNIPPGVTPVMSTPYIQVPFFQTTPMYTYEDVQLLQQRIPPHMTAPYYDMSYQTPTTLAAVRDGTLANVAYSISDGRFTRADNNASPVPSTLSQQTSTLTQGHQAQPILAQTPSHPGWIYPSTYNPMTPSYQFGVMYQQQLPAATNAHGSSNSNQYPKPTTYGSGYGSGYEALTQSQDYSKGAYVSNTQGQSKGAGANSSSTGTAGNDLSAMYGKSHATLGKVNSYEKQGFHSGTPPPFTGTLHGSQNAGLAPSGTGYGPQVYIPTMAPHQQHHSTPLMHQPLHQMEVRHQGRRMESGNSSGQRSQVSSQAKSGAKQGYPTSYWNQA